MNRTEGFPGVFSDNLMESDLTCTSIDQADGPMKNFYAETNSHKRTFCAKNSH